MVMRKNRVSVKVKEKFRKGMRNVIKGLSRKILVYKQSVKNECPNCFFDKHTGKSSGKCVFNPETVGSRSVADMVAAANARQAEWEDAGNTTLRYKYFNKGRCPVCRGIGFLEIHRKRWVDCLVIWDPKTSGAVNDISYTPAGTEGSTLVQLKTDPKYFELFKNCLKMEVDGVMCKLSKPPILRGLGNQSVLVITAFTTDKPAIDSTEKIKEYN
jgi:RNA polymerase subunit RPABC4/transcription elongation factor Spt4